MKVPRFLITAFLAVVFLPGHYSLGQNSKENADFKLAINLYNDGMYDLAAEQLNQFITNFPNTSNSVEARFYLGLTQMKLKRFDDARLTFQSFALTYQDNPRAPEAWMNVGECYVAIRNYREAALAFERVHVFHARSKAAPDALINASKYFKLAGQPEDARRVLRMVLQEYPNSALAARTLLARMYFEEGNLVQAQSELKRVIEGDPSGEAKAQALLILGNVYQAMGDATAAQTSYQEIITKHTSSTATQGAYLSLARLESTYGRFKEAVEDFNKGLAEKSLVDSGLVYGAGAGIGEACAARGDVTDALVYYDKALNYASTAGQTNTALWQIAILTARGKNYARSDDVCQRLLKSDAPETIKKKAAIRLALNAEARRDYARAVQEFTSYLDVHATDPASDEVAFHAASLTEKELLDPRKAIAGYEQFMTRYPQSRFIDDAYLGAANSYAGIKEFRRALQLYKELLQRFPSSEYCPGVKDSIRSIETFEAKDENAGVEKLALLMGDLVTSKDNASLSFRLGEIYFHDLKNYAAAAAQFSTAINSGITDNRFVDALFERARALEYLSWRDSTYVPRAIEAYEVCLKSYPHEKGSADAALSLFLLRASSITSAYAAYDEVTSLDPAFSRQDLLLQRIGLLEEKADSIPAALATYGSIAERFKDSPVIEESAWRRIVLLSSLGNVDSAIHESEAYLRSFPDGLHSAEIMSGLADMLVKTGATEPAADDYRKLTEHFSYTSFGVAARAKLADACALAGKFDEAISLYSDLLTAQENDPLSEGEPDPSLLLALGRTCRLAGNARDAKQYLLRVVASSRAGDLAGSAYTLLGLMAKDEGNVDLATSYFRQAESLTPSAATSREVADMLFDNGAYADAIKQYQSLSRSATSDSDRQYYDARVVVARYRDGQVADAEREAAAFLKQYKDDENDAAAFELEKGLSFYRKEAYAAAQKSFDLVAGKYDDTPSAPWAMYWTGKVLESTERKQDALKQYETVMKDAPASPVIPRVHLALGNLYYDLEKWDESIRNYRLIVDDQDADKSLLPLAMSNLIETYEAAGVFDAALQLTRRYLDLYPNAEDSFDKKIKIGILLQRLGYNDQSVLQLQTLLDQAGSDLEGEIRYYIAEANYNKGDYQQAILDYLKVPYLVTKKGKLDWTANALYMAGQSYEKLGRYDQALLMYQQITERPGIDETFRTAAKKEIDRVKLVVTKPK